MDRGKDGKAAAYCAALSVLGYDPPVYARLSCGGFRLGCRADDGVAIVGRASTNGARPWVGIISAGIKRGAAGRSSPFSCANFGRSVGIGCVGESSPGVFLGFVSGRGEVERLIDTARRLAKSKGVRHYVAEFDAAFGRKCSVVCEDYLGCDEFEAFDGQIKAVAYPSGDVERF